MERRSGWFCAAAVLVSAVIMVGGANAAAASQAITSWITWPPTSVSRKLRPL